MRKITKVWIGAAVMALVCACPSTPDGQPMTDEERWDLALDAASIGLELMEVFAGTDYWEKVKPYHALAVAAVEAMQAAREAGDVDAFKIGREGFLAAMRDFLRWKADST